MSPNDRKLSDTPERRGTCVVGGKAAVEAGAVTRRCVRCSAWLGVAGFIGVGCDTTKVVVGRHHKAALGRWVLSQKCCGVSLCLRNALERRVARPRAEVPRTRWQKHDTSGSLGADQCNLGASKLWKFIGV